MSVSRPAVVALLVGLALLVSPALLLQFQEPNECANYVEPATDIEQGGATVPVLQYDELSPDAQRAFDRARSAERSVIVYGERCPAEFSYTADQHRYEIVADGSRYVLTTYANDLIPEVPIAAGVLAYLGLTLVGIGLATRDEAEARFPVWAGAVSLATLVGVTAAVLLDQGLWVAIAGTGIVTAVTLVGSGAALRPRRALLLGGTLALLPGIVALPLTGVSVVFLAPAVVPLLLVVVGVGGKTLTAAMQ
ncbi:hypothetical protein ACFQH6_12100 [Halobacteriaceae archaeon GCM10025711]